MSAANGPRPAGTSRSKQGGHVNDPAYRLHACCSLRQGLQRPARRGPVHLRTAAGAQGLRTEERLHRRPRVRGRGRERSHRRPPGVPQDDRRGRQAQRRVPGDSGLEVLPLHPQARARRRLQVHAAAQGRQSCLHHRARRRHPHRQAHGGHHRELGRVLQREFGPGGHQGDARGRLSRLLDRQQDALWLQQAYGAGRGEEKAHPGTRPRRLPRGQAHLRHGRGRNGDAAHRPRPQRRGHRQPHRKALVQERHPLHPQKRGLHRDTDLGRQRQGQGRPYTDREGVSRHHLQSQVPAGQQADALPRTEDRTPPQSRKHLPAQRAGQVPQVQQGAQRPGRQERPVLLLRLPVDHEARQGRLRDPQAQRPALRGARHRQDSLQRPH